MSASTSAYRHEIINTRVNQYMHAPSVQHTRKNSHIIRKLIPYKSWAMLVLLLDSYFVSEDEQGWLEASY